MDMYKRLPAIALFAVFIISVVLGFVVAEHRYKALQFGNLDYSYFLQFNVRAFDHSIPQQISLNSFSDGDNMLFRVGPEGYPSVWHWVHFEVIKVIPAFIYTLTQSILASYLFYIVMFFLPLLYGGFLLWRRPEHGTLVSLALISLVTFPSAFLYATGELRAFYLLAPMFVCFVLSVINRRPLAEKIAFLFLFLLVREEALLLSMGVLVWELLRNRRDDAPQKETKVLWGVWAAWLVTTLVWDIGTAYGFHPPVSPVILFPVLFVGLCVFLALLQWLWRQGRTMYAFAPIVLFFLISSGPVFLNLFVMEHVHTPVRVLYSRYGYMLFYVLMGILLAYIYDNRWSAMHKKIGVVVLSLFIVLGAASELLPHDSATQAYVARWDKQAQDDTLVYQVAASLPRDTPVLLDSTTMVAFYLHSNTYAYDFMPDRLFPPLVYGGYLYPANIPVIKNVIASGVSYAVLDNADAQPLLDIIKESGKKATLVQSNATFSYYTIK